MMTFSAALSECNGGVLVASPNSHLREQVLQQLPNRAWPVQEQPASEYFMAML
jgi:hypothetical protein